MKLSIAFLLVISVFVLCDNNILSIRDYYQDNINDTDFHYYLESTNGKYFDVVINNNYQCYSVTKCNFTIETPSKLVIINNDNNNEFNDIKLEKIQRSKFVRYIYDEISTLYENENSTLNDNENSTFYDYENITTFDNENSTIDSISSTVYSTLVNSTVYSTIVNSTVDSYSSFYSNISDVNVTLYIILSLVLVVIIAILVIMFLIGFVLLYRNKCRKPEYI